MDIRFPSHLFFSHPEGVICRPNWGPAVTGSRRRNAAAAGVANLTHGTKGRGKNFSLSLIAGGEEKSLRAGFVGDRRRCYYLRWDNQRRIPERRFALD